MTYREAQLKARHLREKGRLPKSFRLNQKKTILMEAIQIAESKQNKTTARKGSKAVRKSIYETLERQATLKQEISQADFNKKLIDVYLKERTRQELEGVVAITRIRLQELMENQFDINETTFNKLFDETPGVFKTMENDQQSIQLVPEKTKNGMYQLVA